MRLLVLALCGMLAAPGWANDNPEGSLAQARSATTSPGRTFDGKGAALSAGSATLVPGDASHAGAPDAAAGSPGLKTVKPGKVPDALASLETGAPGATPASKTPAPKKNYGKAIAMAGIGWVAVGFIAALLGFGLPVVIGVGLAGAALGAAAGLGFFGELFGK